MRKYLPLLLAAGAFAAGTPLHAALAQQGGGINFGLPVQVVGTPGADAEPPQIAAQERNVYLVWHEFPSATDAQPDVFFARSTDRGRTFAPRRNLSNSAAVASDFEQVAVSGRYVYVVWMENGNEIHFSRSSDFGASFQPAKKLSDVGNPAVPRVAASGKRVYVAWQADGQGGNTDIFFASSRDAGGSFRAAENISNNDGTSEFRDAGLKQIALSGGKVVVTWRDDSVAGAAFEVFAAQGD